MPCPFPGMDPYLEGPPFWPDFHASFIPNWRNRIRKLLPEQYDVRIDEYVSIVSAEKGGKRGMEPDLAVSKHESGNGLSRPHRTLVASDSAVAVIEPVMVPVAVGEVVRQRYLKILHRPGNKVITVLELLSPSNKESEGQERYLQKRDALLHEPVNLVELDLLRGGIRLPMGGPLPDGDYYALVTRKNSGFQAEVWAWTVRMPMPAIRIPLLEADGDIVLDLQSLFSQTYEEGDYERVIDYNADPSDPLKVEDAIWARELIAGHAK